jgi:hypothetical protein
MSQQTGDPVAKSNKPVVSDEEYDEPAMAAPAAPAAESKQEDAKAGTTSGSRAEDILAMIRNRNK